MIIAKVFKMNRQVGYITVIMWDKCKKEQSHIFSISAGICAGNYNELLKPVVLWLNKAQTKKLAVNWKSILRI